MAEPEAEYVETVEHSLDMDELAGKLDVPLEVITSLSNSDEYRIVLEKMVEMMTSKELELTEYETVIRDYMETHDLDIQEKDQQIRELTHLIGEQTQTLDQESTLRNELQITISRYAQAELEREGEASEEPRQASEQSEQSLEVKQQALEETQKALEQSEQSLEVKQQALEETQKALEQSEQSLEEKQQALEETLQTLEQSQQSLVQSQQTIEDMQKASREMTQTFEETWEALETAQGELEETRQDLNELEESLQTKHRDLEESDELNEQLRSELENAKQQLELMETELTGSRERVAELSLPPPEVPGADRQELLRILDRRQHEISRLAEEWKSLSSQLEITSAKKSEFQSTLDELAVQESSLRLKEQLLQQEKTLFKSQNEWLSSELRDKSEQLLSLRKEKVSSLSELESKLAQKQDEVKHLSSLLEDQREAYSRLASQTEESLNKSRVEKEETATLEEHLRRELAQQAKLTELYKSASVDAESRVSELLSGVERLQSLLETLSEEKEQLQAQLDVEFDKGERVERDLSTSLASKKQELSRANDLLTSMRQYRGSLSDQEVLSLSPAAAKASALLKSGKSLTQIYSEHIQVCEELEQARQENLRLNNYIDQIVQELSEKTPALQKLRRDYDSSVHTVSSLNQKLDALMDECESLRLEGDDSVRQYRGTLREKERLKALTTDLGRQVKILLKECEEARGGVASSSMVSHDYHMDVSSSDISSSSQMITRQLVEFRSIEELQEQNQRLLSVVRELGEQNEQQEKETLDQRTQALRSQLDEALEEVRELQLSRERQTEMVKSIVQQRDMYRTLLAQATPLPTDSVREESRGDGGHGNQELTNELKELKEQFEAYRKEKVTNDKMLTSQVEETRDKCSELRLENAKLASKLEHANDRYKLLDNQTSSIKRELEALRSKNLQLSNALSSHQAAINTTTHELLSSREKLSKAEVAVHTMKAERDLLESGEKRARSLYEELLREQRGHQVLLTNLQSIQNNLEKSEFETRARLGSQIEGLERELALAKERLHSEEDRRIKTREAYEMQVKDLEGRLGSLKEAKASVDERLTAAEDEGGTLRAELQTLRSQLDERQTQLQEATDKILRLEDDAGSDFRGRIRILERQLADAKVKVQGLEGQLVSSKKQAEEYKNMSQAYETQLTELNTTTEEFKNKMEAAQTSSQQREQELTERVGQLEAAKNKVDNELQQLSEEKQKQVSALEAQISSLTSDKGALQLELSTTCHDLTEVRGDAAKYAESASETMSNYQRELSQHGKTMNELLAIKDQLKVTQQQLSETRSRGEVASAELAFALSGWEERERRLLEQCSSLETRSNDLTQQNTRLHQEAEKLSARVLTLQEQGGLDTSVGSLDTSGGNLEDKSTEQLWEIIRFVRREREIATTKQEMAESENTRHKQQAEHLQRQLSTAQAGLAELTEAAQLHSESTVQHTEMLTKLESLNVLNDSNKLLRGERDRQLASVTELEGRCEQLQGDMASLRETNKLLTAHKDALVAEKTALRNEVQRWTTRTHQLIEQYNKIDPEEYKKLVEERESMTSQLDSLREEVVSLQSTLTASQTVTQGLDSQCSGLKEQVDQTTKEKESLTDEMKQLQTEVTSKQEEIQSKTVLVGKLRDIGRKYRQYHEAGKKELEESKAENEELKKKLEESQVAFAEASSAPPPLPAEDLDKIKELEEAQTTIESLKSSLKLAEDKYNKIVKTVKVARNRIQALTTEKDKASKEIESTTSERDKLKADQESLQQEHTTLKDKHDIETAKLNTTIIKLQQALKERGPRRKVVPPSISEGTSSLQSSAPTAAVKPTVTTTPTASIRPMAQTTTAAPMAHVTPTMMAPVVNSTQSMTTSSTTPTAAMFQRSVSSQMVSRIPATSVVSSSISTPSTSTLGIARGSSQVSRSMGDESRGVTKRQREEEEQEGGASTSVVPPASKRKKPLVARVRQRQMEVTASSSPSPDTQGETPPSNGDGESQATESQVLAAESQSMEPSEERESTPSITVPETDMDTQSSLGRSEVIEPVSPPPSREPSEMPQVSQSQEQSSVEPSGREAVSKETLTSSEAEMVVRRDSNEGPSIKPEGATGEVSRADSNVAPVDSSEMSSNVGGGLGEGSMADTTQRSEEEGGEPVLSEPPSNKVGEVASEEADEMGDSVERDPSDTGDGVETSEAGDTVQSGSVEVEDTIEDVEGDSRDSGEGDPRGSVEEESEDTVGGEVGESVEDVISVHVESGSPEPETSKGVDPVESEAREGETEEDDEEIEGSESSGEEDDLEEEDEDDGRGTVVSPIVIESSSSSSEDDEQERDEEYELRMESSSDEDVDVGEETAPTESEPSHDQYEPSGGPASSYEYVPSGAGLPEDEPSVNLESVQPLRPTFMPTIRRVLSQGLLFAERSSAVTPGYEVQAEDSVVPHTPVLNEGKQLGMTSRAPPLPHPLTERPTHTVPQTISSLTSQCLTASEDPSTIQSLGESHIDIGSAIVPPALMEESRDLSVTIPLASSEGDIPDIDIDNIVEEDDSSSSEGNDLEEGQLDDVEGEMEELSADGPSTTTTLTESQSSLSLPVTSSEPVVAVTSISEQVSSVAVDTGEEDPPPAKRKPEPIVWSGQGSSSGSVPSVPSAPGSRRKTTIKIRRKGGKGGQS
ncbi:nucleoprotein TPR-like isoform X2 [Halichondria panicea]|uniref:nucleoprotein TPR-like isoform X2 n=1 Tax=Halichondria panicea TaxID=6063 RepID=UPI00312B56E3